MNRPAYQLNSLGIICALGASKSQVADHLLRGDTAGIIPKTGFFHDQDKVTYVGGAPIDLDSDQFALPVDFKSYESRNNRLLLATLRQIEESVTGAIRTYGANRIAIVLGTSTSGVTETENALAVKADKGTLPDEYIYHRQEFGDPAMFLARYLGVTGISYCISTACSSGAKVFGSARRLLENDAYDAVIVGGVDSLCKLTLNGFGALESVSQGRCMPFEKGRDGINIGEGAALFLMTKSEQPQADKVCLLGVGESSDAHHISAPHPEGLGAIAAMKSALADAQLDASDIAYVNAHGTATPQNDAMESKAINAVLGDAVAVNSSKGMTGHTLGAAGSIEAAICWLLISEYNSQSTLPVQPLTGELDDTLTPINLVTEPNIPLREGALMTNSFAFGGSNAALILGRGDYVR